MPKRHRSAHHTYVSGYIETGERHIIGIGREALARRADGQTFPILLSVGKVRQPNGQRFVAIIHDLTAQRAAEQARAPSSCGYRKSAASI